MSAAQSRKFIQGAIVAYRDCADMAEQIGEKMNGFAAFAAASGLDAKQAEDAARAGKAMADQLAESIRAKSDLLKAELDSAPANSKQQRGGHARAESLTPERRSEIAREAAKTRWKGRVQ